jgi:drug/metabolite transporter (DMT)-like permease
MLAGIGFLSLMDGTVKWLIGAEYSVAQIVAVRGWIIVALLLLWVPRTGGFGALRSRRPLAHLGRIAVGFGAVFLFFTSLKTLPLADATVIFFGATFIMTALSALALGERVGVHRWGAVGIGFAGVYVAARPGGDMPPPEALYAVAASLCYAVLMLGGRWLGRTEPVFRLVFYYNAGTALIASLFLPFAWQPMAGAHIGMIVVTAALGLAGHVCLTRAFNAAPVGVIAPFEYSAIVWAALIGFVVWGDVPAGHVYLGGAIIILSGLYVVRREAMLARRRPPPLPAPP